MKDDITFCRNDNCKLKKTCIRYTNKITANNSNFRSFDRFEPVKIAGKIICDMYIKRS